MKGKQDNSFSIQCGQYRIPPAPVNTCYLFSTDVKAVVVQPNKLVAYFRIGAGDNLQVGKFKLNAGWQKVKVPITVLAGQPFGMLNFHGAVVGEAVVLIDNVSLEVIQLSSLDLAPDEVCLTGNATGAVRTRNRRVSGSYSYTEAMTADPCFPYYFPEGYGPRQDHGLYRGWVPFDKGRLADGHTATAVSWPMYWTSFHGRDITFDLGEEYFITRVIVKATWPGLRITKVFLKSPPEKVFTLVAASDDLFAFNAGQLSERTDSREFKDIDQPARWVRVQQEVRSPGNIAEIQVWGRKLKKGDNPKRIPFLQAGGKVSVPRPTGQPEPVYDIPPLFPVPKEMKTTNTTMFLDKRVQILYEPKNNERARITAEVLRDEMKACYGILMDVLPAREPVQGRAILLGAGRDSSSTAKALAASGLGERAKNLPPPRLHSQR